jgi:hypothetical protein
MRNASNPREMITMAEPRFLVCIRIGVNGFVHIPGAWTKTPASKKFSDRKIAAQWPRRCPATGRAQDDPRLLRFHNGFCPQSDWSATGAGALVTANWRGWFPLLRIMKILSGIM